MSASRSEQIIRQAESRAESAGLDLDDVRIGDTESPGTTVKLIAADGETEADQVYAPVEYIEGPMADQMFEDRLSTAIEDLKNHLAGRDVDTAVTPENQDEFEADDDSSDTTAETETTEQVAQSPDVAESSDTGATETEKVTQAPSTSLTITVELDEESFGELQEELDEWLTEVDGRVEDIEARMETIEETLGALGQLTDDE